MELKPVSSFGAEVGGVNLSAQLDPAVAEDLRREIGRHGFLLFRDQTLARDDLFAVSSIFGKTSDKGLEGGDLTYLQAWLEGPASYGTTVVVRERVQEARGNTAVRVKVRADDPLAFHSDGYQTADSPPKAVLLYAIEVPPEGGDTLFADVRGLYAGLPESLQKRAVATDDSSPRRFRGGGVHPPDASAPSAHERAGRMFQQTPRAAGSRVGAGRERRPYRGAHRIRPPLSGLPPQMAREGSHGLGQPGDAA